MSRVNVLIYCLNCVHLLCSRVVDMFHSVQLNVNNPHFLIMQGRITKVLNMKPVEILGLLEEAAGTKMYDKKRDVALKTLEKKEKRLADIDLVWSPFKHSCETRSCTCLRYSDPISLQVAFVEADSLGGHVLSGQRNSGQIPDERGQNNSKTFGRSENLTRFKTIRLMPVCLAEVYLYVVKHRSICT